MDCGPTCLRMIAKYYGRSYTIDYLRTKSNITKAGVSLGGIAEAAEAIGFHTLAVGVDFNTIVDEVPIPCVAHWRQRHFVVIYKITKDRVFVADPAHGLVEYSRKAFIEGWVGKGADENSEGHLLLLETTPKFYEVDIQESKKYGFDFLLGYFKPHSKYIVQLFLGLFVGSVLQLIFPFLTQSLVDYGINYQNINFIYLCI